MKERYNIIDFLRGFTIIHMIIFHLIFDLINFYNFNINMNFYYYQQYICISFVFLAGLCENFSKNRIKRSIILGISSILISVFSFIFDRSYTIYFGVIHFFFSAGIIFYLFEKFSIKLNKKILFFVSLLLFIIFKDIYKGSIFFKLIDIPKNLYTYNLFILGLPKATFTSGDYFPIIPWIFLYFSGYYFYEFLNIKKRMPSKNIINILGRHSLIIYLLHQVILVAILKLILG